MRPLGPKVAVVYRSVAGPGACGLIVRSLDTPNHFVTMSPTGSYATPAIGCHFLLKRSLVSCILFFQTFRRTERSYEPPEFRLTAHAISVLSSHLHSDKASSA